MSERTPLKVPAVSDLMSQVRFDPESGHIWLNESRMILMHAAAMGELRRGLIESLGLERAKGLLMRAGYAAGRMDAELAKRIRPDSTVADAFVVGPQLHKLQGKVKVNPIRLEIDVDAGHYYGELDWHQSWEAEQHLHHFGPADEPVCWTLLGYASGYTSYFMGRQILFKETQCCATGKAHHCVNIGRPADEWPDREDLEKYYQPDSVIAELEALQQRYRQLKHCYDRERDEELTPFAAVGSSMAFRQVTDVIAKAAASKVSILLLGETGVGKEVQARNIHRLSDRADGPFVAVNCASIPPDLIESELFGVERGAYTGANHSREGRFERANHGTIFLDEVVELTPRAQASLLRVLQEEELERVGGRQVQSIDARVVAATNEDLEQAVRDGRFRADLFFRLNVLPVRIPPLRERRDDIPLLIEHFLEKYQRQYNKRVQGITDKALSMLVGYRWPGNVRELENMIERGVILTEHHRPIGIEHFFPSLTETSHPLNMLNADGHIDSLGAVSDSALSEDDGCQHITALLDCGMSMEEVERQLIRAALQCTDGVVTDAAKLLGMSRPALAYRKEKHQL